MNTIRLTDRQIEALLWSIDITNGTLASNDELLTSEIADLNRLRDISEKLVRALEN